jgi:hypothetical protein
MALEIWVQTAAIFLSPFFAVWAGRLLQDRAERRARKYWVLSALTQTRHAIFADDRIRALNTIDLAFGRNDKVRSLYRDYYAITMDVGPDGHLPPERIPALNAKLQELIEAMARDLHIHGEFTGVDFGRGYAPMFYASQQAKTDRLVAAATTFFENFPRPQNPPPGPQSAPLPPKR